MNVFANIVIVSLLIRLAMNPCAEGADVAAGLAWSDDETTEEVNLEVLFQ
jgi:hypothetical protein